MNWPDPRANPLARGPLQIRDDIARAVVDLYELLIAHVGPGGARVWLGSFASVFEQSTAELEGFARPLFGIVPLTVGIIFLLLYLNFRRLSDTLMVIGAIPFALVGGVYLLWALDYDFSVAVGAGFLALAGLTAETGVIMLLFLNQARDRALEDGSLKTIQDLWHATIEGATYRVRPLLMTVSSDVIGLLPIMWGAGTGSETMRRIAAPMVGGVLTATLVTLIVIPVLFVIVHSRGLAGGEDGGE